MKWNLFPFTLFFITFFSISWVEPFLVNANDDSFDNESAGFALVIETEAGLIEGKAGETSLYFKGIPYAEPPVGSLRWQSPVNKTPWEGIYKADEFSKACPQGPSAITGETPDWNEDCLCLNVYRPKENIDNLPVMVFIHGGGHVQGSASLPYYDGEWLAQNKKIVLVTINYRLGQFGYLYLPEAGITGNYGTRDQIKSLEWVKNNIENFGGNPDNITVFGESAGAVSVGMILALVPHLFHKAIIQSGSITFNAESMSADRASEQGNDFAEEIGCADADDVAACLKAMPAEKIISVMTGSANIAVAGNRYKPVLDGELFTDTPLNMVIDGDGKKIPLIMGVNADEGTLFFYSAGIETEEDYLNWVNETFKGLANQVLKRYPATDYEEPWLAAAEILGDVAFVCPTCEILKKLSFYNDNLYQYYFTYVSDTARENGLGAFHGSELSYIFHTFSAVNEKAQQVSENISELWTDFSDNSNPPCDETIWKPFNSFTQRYLTIDRKLSKGMYLKKRKCAFWGRFINP